MNAAERHGEPVTSRGWGANLRFCYTGADLRAYWLALAGANRREGAKSMARYCLHNAKSAPLPRLPR